MIKLRLLIEETIDATELEKLEGNAPSILQYLDFQGKSAELIKLGTDEYIIWDDNIVDPNYINIKKKENWIYDSEGQRLIRNLIGAFEDKFNTQFWNYPQILYHATPTENVGQIKQDGLKAIHLSRGLSNRHIKSAVFTSTEPECIGSYGPSIITINTKLMKEDGFTPYVTKEPNHVESDVTNFIARKIGAWEDDKELSNGHSEGTDDYTVIVHSPIPPKYLSFEMV